MRHATDGTPTGSRSRRALAALAAAGALAAGSPAGAAGQSSFAPIATAPFYEGSGLVASRTHPGVFWALQDSGGPARTVLHAFKVQGGRLVDLRPGVRFRTVRVEGTTNRDWEALSTDSRGNLWVGDLGNNGCTRSDLRVHRVPEPDPFTATSVRVAATYPVAWPDPAGHCTGYDAESLFVVDGVPYVIAKLAPRPGVYRVPTASTTAPNRLQKVGELTPPPNRDGAPPTDAGVSTDGERLVVSVGNRRALVYAATSSLSGESAVRDLVGHPPRWSQPYRADGATLAVEGAAFAAGSYDVAFLSEGREILYFSHASYES